MKITKRNLRRIIREACGDLEAPADIQLDLGTPVASEGWDIPPNPEFGNAPCPLAVADAIKESGASDSDILAWIHALTMNLTGGSEAPEEEFSFTGDVGQLPGDEAFGIGFEAGSRGL